MRSSTPRRCRTARGSTTSRRSIAGARHVVPESRGFDAGGVLRARRRAWRCDDVRGADDGQAARRPCRSDRRARRRDPDDRLRRRADVRRRHPARDRRARRPLRADLRPGREPDDDHRAVARAARRPLASAVPGTASHRSASRKARWRCASPTRPGDRCPCGTTGEILVRGDTVMRGYWRNPEATAQALRDGWLWTGDVGVLDDDGFLTLKDRSKDVIISGGSNIYPREVEEVLLRHPGVAEACVVGRPHRGMGRGGRRLRRAARRRTLSTRRRSTRCASTTSRASSGRRTTGSSPRCRRTTTARCSSASCASRSPTKRRQSEHA